MAEPTAAVMSTEGSSALYPQPSNLGPIEEENLSDVRSVGYSEGRTSSKTISKEAVA